MQNRVKYYSFMLHLYNHKPEIKSCIAKFAIQYEESNRHNASIWIRYPSPIRPYIILLFYSLSHNDQIKITVSVGQWVNKFVFAIK